MVNIISVTPSWVKQNFPPLLIFLILNMTNKLIMAMIKIMHLHICYMPETSRNFCEDTFSTILKENDESLTQNSLL